MCGGRPASEHLRRYARAAQRDKFATSHASIRERRSQRWQLRQGEQRWRRWQTTQVRWAGVWLATSMMRPPHLRMKTRSLRTMTQRRKRREMALCRL